MLSVWAYAYEYLSAPMVSDEQFDAVARLSDPSITTGRLDAWWRANFDPSTGFWVRSHPEIDLLANLHRRLTVDR